MSTLILDKVQLTKVSDFKELETPTNDNYLQETVKNNALLKEKIYEYTEACKNAAKFYVR